MNEYLAQLYDTNGAAEDIHMVKVAHLTVLNKLAQAEGVELDEDDLEGLYDMESEELQGLVTGQLEDAGYDPEAVYAQEFEGGYEETAEEQDAEVFEKESAAQLNEYDFAGRAMAHAFLDEKEKIAGNRYQEAFALARKAATGKRGRNYIPKGKGSLKKRMRAASESLGQVAPEAAGLAAMTGYGVGRSSKRKQSSIDEIAEQRALQIADHYGLQKVASDDDVIDQRALEMLAEAGYDVDSLFEE
jgi:hypothetical protein